MKRIRIEPISKRHERGSFDCGRLELNEFLQKHARQTKQGYSQTWVAVAENDREVVGFITMSMGSVELPEIDPQIAAHLPKHPCPYYTSVDLQ